MSLEYIRQPLQTPDAYWAIGDGTFGRARRQTRSTPEKRIIQRTAELRTNLNYGLLMHDRLILEDTSLLLNPPLMKLLREQPVYSEIFTSGAIVAALRESADSFVDVANIVLARNQYQDLGEAAVYSNAEILDRLRVNAASTPTRANSELMHDLVSTYFLDQSLWKAVGLGDASKQIVRYVPKTAKRNGADRFRRTEFWEFADLLDQRKAYIAARHVRNQMATLAHGLMATSLGLFAIYPSAFAPYVGRVFGTRHPWEIEADAVRLHKPIHVEVELRRTHADIRFLARHLEPQDILGIRATPEYRRYLRSLRSFDTQVSRGSGVSGGAKSYELALEFLEAVESYHRFLAGAVGARLRLRADEWRKVRSQSRLLRIARWALPSATGIASDIVPAMVGASAMKSLALSAMVTPLAGACVHLAARRAERKEDQVGRSARAHAGLLRRPQRSISVELYGPFDDSYW